MRTAGKHPIVTTTEQGQAGGFSGRDIRGGRKRLLEPAGLVSDPKDEHVVCMARDCSQIGDVPAEDGTSRLGRSHNNGVHGRAPVRQCPEHASATSEMFRQVFNDVARLQEAIREDIGPLAST